MSPLPRPASATALRAASACSCRADLCGRMPISSDSATPTMANLPERSLGLDIRRSSSPWSLKSRVRASTSSARTVKLVADRGPSPFALSLSKGVNGMFFSNSLGCPRHRPELRQRDRIAEVFEHDFDLHVTAQVPRVRLDADDVRRDPGAFRELDDGGDEGRRDSQHRTLGDRKRVQFALATGLDPFEVVGPAKRADAARVKMTAPAAPAAREH